MPDQDDIPILAVKAVLALPAGPNSIVVLTELQEGDLANIFTIDLLTGSATFVGTGHFATPALPVAGSSGYVAWTNDYCGDGSTMLFDRASGRLTAIPENSLVSLTSGDLLALGPDLLVDPNTFEFRAVLPPVNLAGPPVTSAWSPDGRFAAYGLNPEGGMTCAPRVEPDQSVEDALGREESGPRV